MKAVLGSRILVKVPKIKENGVILDNATKEEIQKDLAAKIEKLEVFAVGSTVNLNTGFDFEIKPGDFVYIDYNSMKNSLQIHPLEEKNYFILLVSVHDIIFVY